MMHFPRGVVNMPKAVWKPSVSEAITHVTSDESVHFNVTAPLLPDPDLGSCGVGNQHGISWETMADRKCAHSTMGIECVGKLGLHAPWHTRRQHEHGKQDEMDGSVQRLARSLRVLKDLSVFGKTF